MPECLNEEALIKRLLTEVWEGLGKEVKLKEKPTIGRDRRRK